MRSEFLLYRPHDDSQDQCGRTTDSDENQGKPATFLGFLGQTVEVGLARMGSPPAYRPATSTSSTNTSTTSPTTPSTFQGLTGAVPSTLPVWPLIRKR